MLTSQWKYNYEPGGKLAENPQENLTFWILYDKILNFFHPLFLYLFFPVVCSVSQKRQVLASTDFCSHYFRHWNKWLLRIMVRSFAPKQRRFIHSRNLRRCLLCKYYASYQLYKVPDGRCIFFHTVINSEWHIPLSAAHIFLTLSRVFSNYIKL